MNPIHLKIIAENLLADGWFQRTGVHAVVDGQFGSTGKGVAASILAHTVGLSRYKRDFIGMSSAGPNSGHTAVYQGHKMVTQQLPISSVQSMFAYGYGRAYLNAGAIIDPAILHREIQEFKMGGGKTILHPNAAVISVSDVSAEMLGAPSRIASTAKGVGSALSNKILREGNTVNHCPEVHFDIAMDSIDMTNYCSIMEVAQGFSLGVNQQFYPHCTSRECTVAQGMSDANLHPSFLRKTMMAVRTYPIRVGNTDKGNSGGWYPDQYEMTWEELGQPPELTTVTKRVRRIATWSRIQFKDAVRANRPDAIFLNFCNYLRTSDMDAFINDLNDDYIAVMGYKLPRLIMGWGPETEDARLWT